jgi:hypothetical protein
MLPVALDALRIVFGQLESSKKKSRDLLKTPRSLHFLWNIYYCGYAESSSEATLTTKGTKDTKEKSKIMCFPFVIFVFFVVKAHTVFYVNFNFYHEVHEGREAREIKTRLRASWCSSW